MNTPIGTFNSRMLIPGILLTLLAFFAGIFFFVNSGEKKISVKVFVLYSLVTVLCFAMAGFSGLFIKIERLSSFFWGMSTAFFVFGVLHTWGIRFLSEQSDTSTFGNELVFTIFVTMLGGFVFLLVFQWFYGQEYSVYILTGLLLFLTPFLFLKSFHFLIAIPELEYPKWYYPLDRDFNDFDDDEFSDKKTVLLKFYVMVKKDGDEKMVREALAPLRWEFGEYFGFLLTQSNLMKPGEKIDYLDEYGQPNGWLFYIKPKWYQSPSIIDFKLTISENGLTGKEVIVCEKV